MQLVNEFVVPRPVDQTWAVLTDVERIAPAMPGAQLTDRVDDQYHGKVKVKVGPVTAAYAGIAQFKELDVAAHHMVLEATGKEASGRGRATALVTADLTDEGSHTRVKVVTELTISGPLAQFGRGAIAEVSSRLLGQFVSNLETMVLASEPVAGVTAVAPAAPAAQPPAVEPVAPESPAVEPVAPEPVAVEPAASEPPRAAEPAAAEPAALPMAPTTAALSTAGQAPSVPTVSAAAPPAEVNLLKVAGWPILKRLIPVLIVIVVVVVLLVIYV